MVTETKELMGNDSIALEVEDFTGSVRRRASGIPKDATISELVGSLAEQMHLEQQDANGRPVIYGAQSSDGFVLNPSDRVGDVLKQDEVVRLTKSVTAG